MVPLGTAVSKTHGEYCPTPSWY